MDKRPNLHRDKCSVSDYTRQNQHIRQGLTPSRLFHLCAVADTTVAGMRESTSANHGASGETITDSARGETGAGRIGERGAHRSEQVRGDDKRPHFGWLPGSGARRLGSTPSRRPFPEPGTTKNQEGRTFAFTAGLRTLLEAQIKEHERWKKKGHIVPQEFFREVAIGRRGPLRPRKITSMFKALKSA